MKLTMLSEAGKSLKKYTVVENGMEGYIGYSKYDSEIKKQIG